MQAQILVTVLGVLLIILVNWYFFFSKGKPSRASMEDSGIQEVKVVVKGGYSPDVIVVKRGLPVRINFYRDETAECSDTIVFGDFNVRRPLPAFRTTPVEFIPEKRGEYIFTCGMGMMKGRLIVE
ncbi:MAG: cupredoxin domain-containing protein [candidate division Zixibacteria bacterium]|nr:cupredoxin domain-containing protein [candidate division Zixibacteria bacterium]